MSVVTGRALAFAVVVIGLNSLGFVQAEDPKNAAPDEPPVTELLVSPAAEPVPALKFRLLPPFSEQTPGNAALDYERLLSGGYAHLDEKRVSPWIAMPVNKLPLNDVQVALKDCGPLFAGLEMASHRELCDWQLPLSQYGFRTHITQFQELRIAAKGLVLKARLQIAHDDLIGALSSMRTIFKLSRNLNEARLLVTTLIGCGALSQTTETLEAFIQHPKAPNLYWALTDLPFPLMDSRSAVELEGLAMDYEYPQLAVFRSRRLNPDEARRLSDEMLKLWVRDVNESVASIGKTFEGAQQRFASAAKAANEKQILLDAGWSKADVAAMPPEQSAWLISDCHWRIYRDDLFKWAGVPASQRATGTHRAEQQLKKLLSVENNPLADFELARLAPSADVCYASVDRRDRAIALFRVIEALRLHAAAHNGELPSSLDQVDSVPIPIDSTTGKAFHYHRAGDGVASLQTPPLQTNNRFYGRHFRIRVRK